MGTKFFFLQFFIVNIFILPSKVFAQQTTIPKSATTPNKLPVTGKTAVKKIQPSLWLFRKQQNREPQLSTIPLLLSGQP